MASLNRVFLIGNLTKDPDVRYTPAGKAVGDLRMAVSRRYKTASGENKEETCFVSVVVWGRQAETCGEYLRKGSSAFIEGRLQYDEWEKDGQKHNRLRVVADRVQFMSAPKGGGSREAPGEASRGAEEAPVDEAPLPAEPADSDNLPF
jgi:single-strand DNA-binding protein